VTALSEHQRAALDRYEELQARYPQLFSAREMRRIVTVRAAQETYAAQHRAVIGVAAETPWFFFLNDLVEPASGGAPYAYSRLVSRGQLEGGTNVAVLALIDDPSLGRVGEAVVIEQERHATGRCEIAVPRGFGQPGLDGSGSALRELREESGYLGTAAEFLGESVIDSGEGDARVSFYLVRVNQRGKAAPEREESIRSVRTMPPEAIWSAILSGEITDSFTMQALALAGYGSKRMDAARSVR
jgi:ADP-ribose pyrophosphatase